MPADEGLRGDVELLSGTPRTSHEVAIDATSAEEHDIAARLDDQGAVPGPTHEFTVVGTVGFGGEKNLGGTTSAYFDTATAQRLLGKPGFFDSIGVRPRTASARPSWQRLNAVVPDGTEAVTGTPSARRTPTP
jgi:putative ABC transport system permease protein